MLERVQDTDTSTPRLRISEMGEEMLATSSGNNIRLVAFGTAARLEAIGLVNESAGRLTEESARVSILSHADVILEGPDRTNFHTGYATEQFDHYAQGAAT